MKKTLAILLSVIILILLAMSSLVNAAGQLEDSTIQKVSGAADRAYLIDDKNNLYAAGNGFNTEFTKILSGVVSVSAGSSHTVYLDKNGNAYGFGSNNVGQLGKEASLKSCSYNNPVLISSGIASVYAGYSYTLLLNKKGELLACGYNYGNLFGVSSKQNSAYFTPVKIAQNFYKISASRFFVFGIKNNNELWNITINKKLADNVKSVSGSADRESYCFVTLSGELYTWGTNYHGQLGNGDSEKKTQNEPMKVNGISDVSAAYMGENFMLVLTGNGKLYGCGSNTDGQLLLDPGVKSEISTLQQIGTGFASVTIAGTSVFAAKSSGASTQTLCSWGNNSSGQLGNGKKEDSFVMKEIGKYLGEIETPTTNTKPSTTEPKNEGLTLKSGSKYVLDSAAKLVTVNIADVSVQDFAKEFTNASVIVSDDDGNDLTGSQIIKTGLYVTATGDEGDIYNIVVLGDTDGNGTITAVDARIALRVSAELEELKGAFFNAAAVLGNDSISATDARKILRVSASLETF